MNEAVEKQVSKTKSQVFVQRLVSTLVLWALVMAVYLSHQPWAYMVLMVVGGAAATREYFSMAEAAKVPNQTCLGIVLGVAYLLYVGCRLAFSGAHVELHDGAALAIAAIVVFAAQLREQVVGDRPIVRVAVTMIGLLYVPFLFSFMARLLMLPDGSGAVPGAALVVWLVAVTKFTDMGAYLTGSLIGKHKMIPHISEGKTWEGFFGAIFWAELAACGLYVLMPEKLEILNGWGNVVLLGALLAVLAVLGDLAESIVKRSFGAKDSGAFLPGIGGALDLLDSLCFTAPVLYFYLVWIS